MEPRRHERPMPAGLGFLSCHRHEFLKTPREETPGCPCHMHFAIWFTCTLHPIVRERPWDIREKSPTPRGEPTGCGCIRTCILRYIPALSFSRVQDTHWWPCVVTRMMHEPQSSRLTKESPTRWTNLKCIYICTYIDSSSEFSQSKNNKKNIQTNKSR